MDLNRGIIQFGGTVRSGTTMGALVLANHENAMALGEIMHLFYPYRKNHYEEIDKLKQDTRWANIIEGGPTDLYYNIFKNFPETLLIIDSSKDPFWFRETAQKASKQYKIQRIVTFKSPEELKKSFEKRALKNWQVVYINYYKRFFSLFPDTPSLYFNKFLKEENYLHEVVNYFGLPNSENRMEYWDRKQPNFFGSETVHKKVVDKNSISLSTNDGNAESARIQHVFNNLKKRELGNKIDSATKSELKYSKLKMLMYYYKDYAFKTKKV